MSGRKSGEPSTSRFLLVPVEIEGTARELLLLTVEDCGEGSSGIEVRIGGDVKIGGGGTLGGGGAAFGTGIPR